VKLQRRLSQQHTAHHLSLHNGGHVFGRRRAAVARSRSLSYIVLGWEQAFASSPHAVSEERAECRDWSAQPQPHRQPHFWRIQGEQFGGLRANQSTVQTHPGLLADTSCDLPDVQSLTSESDGRPQMLLKTRCHCFGLSKYCAVTLDFKVFSRRLKA
jgi:hypothetical protein